MVDCNKTAFYTTALFVYINLYLVHNLFVFKNLSFVIT